MSTRRDFLIGASVASYSAVAGCLHSSETTEDPAQGPVDWFPTSITDYQQPYVGFAHLADALSVEAFANSVWGEPILGVDPADIDTVLYAGSADPEYRLDALVGDFAADSILASVEDQEGTALEEAGQYGDFDRYEHPDSDEVLGLQEGIALDAETELFEAVVDARAGDAGRLVDEHDDFASIVDATEEFHFFQSNVEWSWEDAATVAGETRDIAAQGTDITRLAVYQSAADAEAGEQHRRDQFRSEYQVSDIEATVDGTLLVLSGTVDTSQLYGRGGDPLVEVVFQYEYDPAAKRLVITVAGGDTVEAGNLVIQGDRTYGHAGNTWEQYADGKAVDDVVAAGDSIELGGGDLGDPVEADFQIDLYYEDFEFVQQLDSHSGPDA